MAFSAMTVVYIVTLLVCGSLNTITMKISLSLPGVGLTGKRKIFEKPWFVTFVMFVAMATALIVDYFQRRRQRQKNKLEVPLMDVSPNMPKFPKEGKSDGESIEPLVAKDGEMSYWRKVVLCSIPATFDLLATGLCAMGFLYISASVWQLLRGAEMIFAAMFGVLFLKQELYAFNVLGLSCCFVGLTCVGVASILGTNTAAGDKDSGLVILGMSLALGGQVVQAAQVTAEEWLMKDVDLPGNVVCGFEGVWGLLLMQFVCFPLFYLLPGDDDGHFENEADTIAMLSSSRPLLVMFLTYTVSCAIYNMSGLAVTADLTAVHRVMIEALRTLLVWAFDLYVHYFINATSSYGEVFTSWSVLEIMGFILILVGTMIHGGLLKVKGLKYPPEPKEPLPSFSSPGAIRNLGLIKSPSATYQAK